MVAILATWGSVHAKTKTIQTQTDSSGYTHYSGDGLRGVSHTDSSGITHYRFERDGKVERCRSHRNSIGVVTTTCD